MEKSEKELKISRSCFSKLDGCNWILIFLKKLEDE